MFRQLKPYQLAIDVSIGALCLLARTAFGYSSPVVFIVVLVMAAAVAVRRLSPILALVLAWGGALILIAGSETPDVATAAVLPVLYVTARYGGTVTKWVGLASAGGGAFVATTYVVARGYGLMFNGQFTYQFSASDIPQISSLFLVSFFSSLDLFGLSWTLGLLVKTWATARASRAGEQAAIAEQEIAHREVGIEQERTRIARDMHDVVAHSLAVVIAQADGARYARAQDPDAVDDALTTISSTAREALADVRILLGQLRHSQGEAPQPVLADLDRLFDQLAGSGLTIARSETGQPGTLATGQQLAVYRIVQESLTNALRHGDTTTDVSVSFDWTDDVLTLTISNALPAEVPEPVPGRSGHGLDGMRERAVLAGGTLSAAPVGDRFVVTATLPVIA